MVRSATCFYRLIETPAELVDSGLLGFMKNVIKKIVLMNLSDILMKLKVKKLACNLQNRDHDREDAGGTPIVDEAMVVVAAVVGIMEEIVVQVVTVEDDRGRRREGGNEVEVTNAAAVLRGATIATTAAVVTDTVVVPEAATDIKLVISLSG